MTERKSVADGREIYEAKHGKKAAEPPKPPPAPAPGTLAAGAKLYQTRNDQKATS
ncbi:hypothetical protein [Pseudarthrobacter sp. BIM B-2242]|uniref:hypothetical protein n=1 Tax=Pseudarthrobacter sp. BIM B-2242 TaxID=2772401 RepID=UPI00168A9BFE|nr:hypothetical protein [Pseudarthrobacter sp. BIM B-2242]QOD04875.1 hypothetical protein IDT60_07635 [Pseudarthrobacter sp. BIM B-2242]